MLPVPAKLQDHGEAGRRQEAGLGSSELARGEASADKFCSQRVLWPKGIWFGCRDVVKEPGGGGATFPNEWKTSRSGIQWKRF